jgi:hypothetical protein
MKTIWRFLLNIFDNISKNSFKKMLLVVTDHTSKLEIQKTDPDIGALFTRTSPVSADYSKAYSDWTAAKGNWEGETLRFNQKMTELVDQKIKQWDAKVRAEFLEDTADYTKIFPGGRTGFRNGAYDVRINHVGALATALMNYPSFAALQTEVDTYHKALLGIRNVQTHNEELVKNASDLLEQKRKIAARMLYANLGKLMDKYKDDPLLIEKYFDLSLLRTTSNGNGITPEPEPVTAKVPALQSVTILEGGFDANSYFNIANTGTTSLKFYTAKLPNDAVSPSAIEVLAGEETDVFASELGADGNLFLMAYNPDEVNEGEYSLMLLDQEEK